jgi:hypothetical protein
MKMLTIQCEVIPHTAQRYPTVGDWQWEGDTLKIRVSKMSDHRYEKLITLHEINEALLAKWCGVEEKAVDIFDITFEEERARGEHNDADEPGDDLNCPVYPQHQIATITERQSAQLLGVNWNDYARAVEDLP